MSLLASLWIVQSRAKRPAMTDQTPPGHNPTEQTYIELKRAFDHFNAALFDGSLPGCLITLQRQHDTFSYFSPNQFVNGSGTGEMAHEIALNPAYFAIRPIEDTLASLVTEMVSLKQLISGTPGRKRYRNREWADMMESVGLMPSDTWEPGGRRVGEKVGCYVIEGGAFDTACAHLVDEAYRLSWLDRFPPSELRPGKQAFSLTDDALDDEPGLAGQHAGAADLSGPAMLLEHDPAGAGAGELLAGELPSAMATALDLDPDSLAGDGQSSDLAPAAPAPAPQATPEHHAPKAKPSSTVNLATLQALGVEPQARRTGSTREKYSCPSCEVNVWGKPGLLIGCYSCADKPVMKAAGLLAEAADTPTEEAVG